MASIQGVKVTGVIVPSDTLDTYAVIDPIYGVDGLRNLTGGTSDLNLITTDRRRAGMVVGINNGSNYYKLNSAPWNNTLSDWTPFLLGDTSPISVVNTSNLFSTGLAGTGVNASGITSSNFFGVNAGNGATIASNSNFFGLNAGSGAISADSSNFLGNGAGFQATNANGSNFLGLSAGYDATYAMNSNFFGPSAGQGAISADSSTFIGLSAGRNATNANGSNFIGQQAGINATYAYSSNFMGLNAGYQAIYANDSNFYGSYAGYGSISANSSNFFGISAGANAPYASYSNFFGTNSGNESSGASNSNFFGNQAGNLAINASYSNFFGYGAGFLASATSYSNFFGYNAGRNIGYGPDSGSLGSNNIIIGTNISLPPGTTNSINLGGVLFGTGTYSTTTGNPSLIPTTSGKIGINKINPTNTLHIYSETANTSGLRLERLTSTSPTSTGQAIGVDANGNVVTIVAGSGGTGTDTYLTGGTYTSGTTTLVNNTGVPVLITGYTDSPFEKVDEGSNLGIIIRGRVASNYGPIGEDAVDISYSSSASTTVGATGTNSFAQGYDVIASGNASCAFGDITTAGGSLGFVTGRGGYEAGYGNFLTGAWNIVTDGAYATVVGQFANSITNNIGNINDGGNTMFAIGNGTGDGSSNPLVRSTAFQVFQSGLIIAPSLSTSIISTEATGKVLITREYLTGYTNTNLQKTISASYTATSADNNYTILINNGATPISITTPSGLLDKINVGFIQQGSADVTFVAGAGVTINSPANMLKIKGQHYWAYLEQVTNSNIYQLVGSLKL